MRKKTLIGVFMLKNISNFMKKFSTGSRQMENRKVVFIVEANVNGEREKEFTRKIRAVRTAVKTGVNSIEGVKATRIQNQSIKE